MSIIARSRAMDITTETPRLSMFIVSTLLLWLNLTHCSSNYEVPREFVGYLEQSTLNEAREEAFPTTFN